MSKKNWFLIIGLASLALIFIFFVAKHYYVRNKNIEIRIINKNAKESEAEIEAYHRSYTEKEHEKIDEMQNIIQKIALLIQNFRQKFTNDKDANLIISDNKYNIADKENQINDDFLKSLGNFLGKLNANLKKLNEIKFDSSKIQKKINELKESLNELQEYFNKGKEDYYNTIIEISQKIIFKSYQDNQFHNLFIIQNEELIINPEILKFFTEEKWRTINESKEDTEKNLNQPNTILEGHASVNQLIQNNSGSGVIK